MTDKPSGVFVTGKNGKHTPQEPARDGEAIDLGPGYWRGCTVDGTPRDPANPAFWSSTKRDS